MLLLLRTSQFGNCRYSDFQTNKFKYWKQIVNFYYKLGLDPMELVLILSNFTSDHKKFFFHIQQKRKYNKFKLFRKVT